MFPSSATLWGEGSVWGRFKPQPGEPWLREQAGELKQQFGLPLRTSEIWQTKKSKKNAANICVDAFKVRVPKRHMFILDTPFTWKSTTINKKCISFWMMTNPFKKMVKLTKTNLLKKRWSRTWKYRISWTCVLVPIPIFHSWRNSSRRFLHANARRGTKYFEARAALRPSQWYQLLPRFCHKKKGDQTPAFNNKEGEKFSNKTQKKKHHGKLPDSHLCGPMDGFVCWETSDDLDLKQKCILQRLTLLPDASLDMRLYQHDLRGANMTLRGG